VARIDELLAAMQMAARENRRQDFDELEADLLDLYPGGLRGMPPEVYQRYLEVDRQWPVVVGDGRAASDPELGPRAVLTARIPELQIAWLVEEGARAGRTRAEVLSACLRLVEEDEQLRRRLRDRLRAAPRAS